MSLGLDFSNTPKDDVIPEGSYKLAVYSAEVKDVKDKPTCKRLVLTLKVTEGEHEGRRFFESFNIIHDNEKTKNIAINQLRRLRIAAGQSEEQANKLNSASDVVGLQFLGQVKIQAADNGYQASNKLGKATPIDLMAGTSPQTSDVPF